MGPAAGLMLHRLILANTKAGSDQEHLKVLHMSFSEMIDDRTESLLDDVPEKPADAMADIISAAYAACTSLGTPAVVGIPCNAFHAPPIWNRFTEKIEVITQADSASLKLVNMIDETLGFIQSLHAPGCGIGILSTIGTRNTRLYSAPLKAAGYNIIEPGEQNTVHDLIYNPQWGIKSELNISDRVKHELHEQILKLTDKGAELIILGCTEFPLAVDDARYPKRLLLDPMQVLARVLVKAADPDKLRL